MPAYIRFKHLLRRLTSAALCLALCLCLPFLTGQIPQIGQALCPMHIPVLLAGFLCGPWWAMAVGLAAPLLRHIFFAMPPLVTALAMCCELGIYGLISGLLYRVLPRRTGSVYAALITAMLGGRVVWGCAMATILRATGSMFTWAAFWTGAFASAVPGMLLHILLIPTLVIALQKAGFLPGEASSTADDHI